MCDIFIYQSILYEKSIYDRYFWKRIIGQFITEKINTALRPVIYFKYEKPILYLILIKHTMHH